MNEKTVVNDRNEINVEPDFCKTRKRINACGNTISRKISVLAGAVNASLYRGDKTLSKAGCRTKDKI